jgi:large subunit ribosomal protein L13
MIMIIYDAENHVLGRMSSAIAKQLLSEERVVVVNAEKAVVSGNPTAIIKHYQARVKRGDPIKGPFFPRTPDGILRRSVRGMLPWKKAKGRAAYKRLRVYIGVPEKLKPRAEKFERIKSADASKLRARSIKLGELSVAIGAKKRW